jgi:RNA 3'-terminal phosphate cyclase
MSEKDTDTGAEMEPAIKFCVCQRCGTPEERKKAEEVAKKAAEKATEELKQNPIPHR